MDAHSQATAGQAPVQPGYEQQEQIHQAPVQPQYDSQAQYQQQPVHSQAQAQYQPQPPVTHQPQQTAATTTTGGGAISDRDVEDWKQRFNQILAQPSEHINSRSAEGASAWSSSFCGCFDPIDTCLITCCVPCVTFGKTHHRLRKGHKLEGYEPINTSCLLFCAASCFGLHWLPESMQRADIRQKYHIQGSCLGDLARACCCPLCDLVQQDKEAASREPHHAEGGVKQQYQAPGGMTYPGGQ